MVVTDRFEMRAGPMRIISGTGFLASNVCLNEVQRGLSHTTLHGLTCARRFRQPKRRLARVSIITAVEHNVGDSDISWQAREAHHTFDSTGAGFFCLPVGTLAA